MASLVWSWSPFSFDHTGSHWESKPEIFPISESLFSGPGNGIGSGNEVGVWALAGISAMARTRLRAEAGWDDVLTDDNRS